MNRNQMSRDMSLKTIEALRLCENDTCVCDECVCSDDNVKKWRALMGIAADMLEKLIAENKQLGSALSDAVKTIRELKEECSALKNHANMATADIELALSEGEMSCDRCAYFCATERKEDLPPECKREPLCRPKWRGIMEEET